MKNVVILGGRWHGRTGKIVRREGGMVIVDLDSDGESVAVAARIDPEHVYRRNAPPLRGAKLLR